MRPLEEFSETYRVKIVRDSCGEPIIAGKPRTAKRPEDRCHIFEHSEDGKTLGVCLLFSTAKTAKRWGNGRRRLLAEGFTLWQDGDQEGVMLFDSASKRQCRAAIREAGIRRARVYTTEQLEKKQALARSNFGPHREGSYGSKNARRGVPGPRCQELRSNEKTARNPAACREVRQ